MQGFFTCSSCEDTYLQHSAWADDMVWLVRSHQARHEGLLGLEGGGGGALPRRHRRRDIGHNVCPCRPFIRHDFQICSLRVVLCSVVVCVSLSVFGSAPLSGQASERETSPRPARATAPPPAGRAAEARAMMIPHTPGCCGIDFQNFWGRHIHTRP